MNNVTAQTGFTDEELGQLTRKTLDRLNEALDAMKVSRTTWQGEVCEEHSDIDWYARLKAAALFFEALGVGASNKNTPRPVIHQEVRIDLSSWTADGQAPVITVIPSEAQQS